MIYNSSKNNKYSFNKKSFVSNNDSINSQQNSCLIAQPKQFFERYSLDDDSNIFNSNRSFLEIENNLIKEINKMKKKINKKQKKLETLAKTILMK